MHGSAPWKTEETIVGLPRLLILSVFSRFGGCHLPRFRRVVRESGKPHRIIAAAANCTEATLNRILRGRVHTCTLDTLEAIAAALGYEVKLVKKGD